MIGRFYKKFYLRARLLRLFSFFDKANDLSRDDLLLWEVFSHQD
jgi:hypothetical protein